jgi:hypothetical protein
MAFNVSGLTAYVDANKDKMLVKSIFSANTLKTIQVISGIKGTQLIPKTNASVILQAGGCGWSASGTTVLGDATITAVPLKVNQAFCVDDLNGTAFQNRIKAGIRGEEVLPEEQVFSDDLVKAIAKEIENYMWQGDSSATSGYNLVDGFYKSVTVANGAVSAGSLTLTTAANVLSAVESMILLIPADVQAADDLTLFLNPANFLKLAQGIRTTYGLLSLSNSAADGLGESFMFPGSNIKVVKTYGLGTSNRFYLGQASNFMFGTDMEANYESLDIWYSKDNQEVRAALKFKMGVTVGYIDQIVVSTNA